MAMCLKCWGSGMHGADRCPDCLGTGTVRPRTDVAVATEPSAPVKVDVAEGDPAADAPAVVGAGLPRYAAAADSLRKWQAEPGDYDERVAAELATEPE